MDVDECVKEIRRVSSWMMHLGKCIKREFWSVISVYVTGMERSEEERNSFWEKLKGCIESWEDRGRCMNARMGDSEVEGVEGIF